MDIPQYLRAVRAHWIVVVALAALGAVAAGVYSWMQAPQYTASVQLFVSISNSAVDVGDLNQGGSFAQQRVKSYADIVDSPTVTDAVIESLRLPYTSDELAEKIKSSSPVGTVLLDISVTDGSPERARDIANAIANEFPRFIAAIETPTGAVSSPVKASLTRSASLPGAPVSPTTELNVALGLMIGLVSGVGSAVLRQKLDRTIRGKREAAALADAPILGEVAEDSKSKKDPLITDSAGNPRGEAFRALRTNIRFLSVDQRLSSFVVTGSLPGEGKTTVATNLAIALAQAGERVVLIDGDLRRPQLSTLFGLPGGVGLTNVLVGDVAVDNALQQWRHDLQLYVMTSGPIPPNPSELLGSNRLASMVQHLMSAHMTVIFDSPPLLLVTDAAILARMTHGALVVTRIGSTKTDQLEGAVEALRAVEAKVLGVVANRVKKTRSSAYGGYYTAQPTGRSRAAVPSRPQGVPASSIAQGGPLRREFPSAPPADHNGPRGRVPYS